MVNFLMARPGAVIRSTLIKAGFMVLTLAVGLGISGMANAVQAQVPDGPNCLQLLAPILAQDTSPNGNGLGLRSEIAEVRRFARSIFMSPGKIISNAAHTRTSRDMDLGEAIDFCLWEVIFAPPPGL